MHCRDVQQKLDLYARGELAPLDQAMIEAHLRTCETCQRELSRLQRLEELLNSVPAPPTPQGFAARVVAELGREVTALPLSTIPASWYPLV